MRTNALLISVLILLLTSCGQQRTKQNNETQAEATSTSAPTHSETSTDKELTLNYPGSSITYQVIVSDTVLCIIPQGLSLINDTMRHDLTGYSFVNAETGDLDLDGYPELFVYLVSDGSGSYGELIGYSPNAGKSLSQVYLPEISEDTAASAGYMGHDEMAIVESTFCRRFPIYKEGDTNANPTGGTRQIQYKLVKGEASKYLKIDKVLEF